MRPDMRFKMSLSISSSRGRCEDAKMRHLCEDDDLRVSKTLQNYPWFLFFLSFLFFSLFFPHLFAQKMHIVSHDICITAILLSTITTAKVLVVHSLSPTTKHGKNEDINLMTQVI